MKTKVLPLAVLAAAVSLTQFHAAQSAPTDIETPFAKDVKPFLTKYCQGCHNADNPTSGVRVDNLDSSLDDRHIRFWEAIRHRVADGTMPPKGMPQPPAAAKQPVNEWITKALDIARLRPAPKNGLVRRLTVSQYRNTLREVLQLEDDLTEILPPDAVSKDGFQNNKDTLQLSPLLMETYLEIAEESLNRSIVDPKSKPAVQNFRVDLGAGINKNPIQEELILGANSHLLENNDFTVTQLTPAKPFPYEPFFMKTKYRFIEGYQGNDTVRGWREYDSIYHAVFACMRGSSGYPKGKAYGTVPEGLVLRPAIPNEEQFDGDGTYGPKANFKISLRELPDNGRFRVSVMAARYNDGLLLDDKTTSLPSTPATLTHQEGKPLTIAKPGLYQVAVHTAAQAPAPPAPDASRLKEGLSLELPLNDGTGLTGESKFVDSPFGKALSLTRDSDTVSLPRTDALNVGTGEFTISAWVQPRAPRKAGLINAGGSNWIPGWSLEFGERGVLRFEATGPDNVTAGVLATQPGIIRVNTWQHVAAVIKRGKNASRLYVNGYLVARGDMGAASFDNAKLPLHLGRIPNTLPYRGDIDEVRLHRRALSEAELQALIEPGRKFAQAPAEKPQEVTLSLNDHQFTGTLTQPAFVAVRLDAGPLNITTKLTGSRALERVELTPIPPATELARRFLAFEKRAPRLGVHLGLRRDCGSTFSPVGPPQTVNGAKLQRYIFEGAIRNFPSPDVEKDNVNYLAGVREIAVRSEYTDGRDMPRMLIRSVEFEGPFYEAWPPPSHKAIFIDSPRKADPAAYARDIIRNFATRAYRRPITVTEESALMAVYQKSTAAERSFNNSIKDALQVVLTSPQFLFLVETSVTPGPEPLDSGELASKLSYFLWNGPPDKQTMRLASAGTLRANLDAEIDRMVADPRFANFTREFTGQWLSLDKFQVLEPDRKRYPKLTRDARIQLRQEPVQFIDYLFRHNLPARNIIASDFIVANETVASYYDLADKSETGFQFTPIAHGRRELGGILTQPAIMAGLSDGRESNPVKRGAWLARKIISEPPADPPPNVPALKEDPAQKLTLRQRIERHRSQPGCIQCHSGIDPWGIAFEEFDAGGRLKKEPADASSTLPDKTEVKGIDDLRRYLANDRMDQVAFSILKHLATYGTGRTLTYSEQMFLKEDSKKLRASGYRMRDLIHYVASSKMFLEK